MLIICRHNFRMYYDTLCWVTGWKGWEPLTEKADSDDTGYGRQIKILVVWYHSSLSVQKMLHQTVGESHFCARRWESRRAWLAVTRHAVKKRSFLLFQACHVWEQWCKIKLKRRKEAFVFGKNELIEKQLVHIPSESNGIKWITIGRI